MAFVKLIKSNDIYEDIMYDYLMEHISRKEAIEELILNGEAIDEFRALQIIKSWDEEGALYLEINELLNK